jgi:hypothetical protein
MLKILSTIDAGAKGFIHIVEEPFAEAGKLESLVATFKVDEPELKTACLQIVTLVTGEEGDFSTDVTGAGLNLSSDMKTFTDAGLLITYVKGTFVPLVKSVYADFKGDLDPAPAPAAPAAAAPAPTIVVDVVDTSGAAPQASAAASEVKPGPGLHAVVAA